MSPTFPLYAQIAGKLCLVVGGGPVAERKVADLLNAEAEVRLVSPDVTDTLRSQAEMGKIVWIPATYTSHHLDGVWLVFATTNVRTVNAAIAQDATAHRLLVNVADAPDEGSFLVPTVVRRGKLCMSVSTGGANPILARRIAQELASTYGEEYSDLVELLAEMRTYSKESAKQNSAPISTVSAVSSKEIEEIEETTEIKAKSKNSREASQRLNLKRDALARLVEHEAELRQLLRSGERQMARDRAIQLIDEFFG